MSTQSPFLLVQGLVEQFATRVQPPHWMVDEIQRRVVLLLNHVLGQEPQAMARLVRQQGRVVQFRWRTITLQLLATPAGLLDRAPASAQPDLVLNLVQDSPLELARSVVQGGKPEIRIEGDVQLAADIQWLADHVRWDLEEDLSRVVGDVPAHTAAEAARAAVQALRRFVGERPPGAAADKAAA